MIDLLNAEFENYRPQLKSYLFRITTSVKDTEDIVQETYLKAVLNINTFKGQSSLKTWVFAIASNLAKDNLRDQKRWPEDVNDICKAQALADPDYFPEMMRIQADSPHGQFEIKEHIAFCLTCISKSLPLEQQICIFLKEVYGFKINEISTIIDASEAMVKYYLHTARSRMTDIFEKRCALINKEGICHQCSELNGIFNPKQNFEVEKNKIEMARLAEKGDKEHLLELRLQIMQSIDPFRSNGADLQIYHLEYNRKVMENIFQKDQG